MPYISSILSLEMKQNIVIDEMLVDRITPEIFPTGVNKPQLKELVNYEGLNEKQRKFLKGCDVLMLNLYIDKMHNMFAVLISKSPLRLAFFRRTSHINVRTKTMYTVKTETGWKMKTMDGNNNIPDNSILYMVAEV